jgi:transposase InsO family protein
VLLVDQPPGFGPRSVNLAQRDTNVAAALGCEPLPDPQQGRGRHEAAGSTGSVGDSYDNAMAESFFSSLKTELIYRQTWTSRPDAELAIFAWIEGWYNPERIIAGLGMRNPDEYEAAFYADTQNPNLDTTVKVGNPESSLQ